MFHVKQWVVEQAGVDWVTVTSSVTQEMERLYAVYKELRDVAIGEGNEEKEAGFLGYRGLVSGGAFFGSRPDGAMLRVSGALAHTAVPFIRAAGGKVTRLDVQCTIKSDEKPERVITGARNQALCARMEPSAGRKVAVVHIAGHGDGDSLYLGKRTSEAYGRVYDKGAESGDAELAGLTRFEVEYKGDKAAAVWAELCDVRSVERYALGLVCGQFGRWGVRLPLGDTEEVCPPVTSPHTSDTAKKLRWLQEQVRGTVDTLAARGLTQEVIDALGLSWYIGDRQGCLSENTGR